MKNKIFTVFASILTLLALSVGPAFAESTPAILAGLVKDGAKVAVASDAKLDATRAKGTTYFLNLTAADVNRVYTVYDANYNYIGGASWHQVTGVNRTVATSTNIDYYYDAGSYSQLYKIDWNAQRVFVGQSGKVINYSSNTYVGLYGNFGNIGGYTLTNLPTPTTQPINIMLR